jgi:hypothetical protein
VAEEPTDHRSGSDFDARHLLRRACALAGISCGGTVVIRHRRNHLFRLREAGLIGRVSPPDISDRVVRGYRAAQFAHEQGVPVAVGSVQESPLVFDDGVVMFLDDLSQVDRRPTEELASVLRQLHSLHQVPSQVELPTLDPLAPLVRLLNENEIAAECRSLVADRLGWLTVQVRERWPSLGQGLVHGDAHAGNLLRDKSGRAVLTDWDEVCLAPPFWDHMRTYLEAARWGLPASRWDRFRRAYGEAPELDVARLLAELVQWQIIDDHAQLARHVPALAERIGWLVRTMTPERQRVRWFDQGSRAVATRRPCE